MRSSLRAAISSARASGGALQHRPHSEEMREGSGMRRPGSCRRAQHSSVAMALDVVEKVIKKRSCFARKVLFFPFALAKSYLSGIA